MAKKFYKSKECLNCQHPIDQANYCPQCGQINSDKRLSFKQIIGDFFGEYLTFDSKFFHSFVPLITKPGRLTNEYNQGKRNSYIFPLRLYMFTTFLFFLIITMQNKISGPNLEEQRHEEVVTKDSLNTILNKYPIEARDSIIKKIDDTFFLKLKEKGSHVIIEDGTSADSLEPGFFKHIVDKLYGIEKKGKEGWRLFWMELLNQTPKLMFLLLPVFALILKLLYARRKILYINHLIFSLHAHTVIFIYLIIANIFPRWYIILLMIAGIWLHLFFAFRKVYQQSRWKTFFKLNTLLIIYYFALGFGFALLVLLTAISS